MRRSCCRSRHTAVLVCHDLLPDCHYWSQWLTDPLLLHASPASPEKRRTPEPWGPSVPEGPPSVGPHGVTARGEGWPPREERHVHVVAVRRVHHLRGHVAHVGPREEGGHVGVAHARREAMHVREHARPGARWQGHGLVPRGAQPTVGPRVRGHGVGWLGVAGRVVQRLPSPSSGRGEPCRTGITRDLTNGRTNTIN